MSLPISLPEGYVAVVKEGDEVVRGQVVAQRQIDEEIVNIPQQLHISLEKVKDVLKKDPGDLVKIGDDLAVKKSFWGEETAIISKVDGVVDRYERTTGNLVINKSGKTSEEAENVISPVAGVVGLCNNDTIVIESASDTVEAEESEATSNIPAEKPEKPKLKSNAKSIQGITGVGGSTEGEIVVLEESFSNGDQDLIYALDSKTIETIVVSNKLTKEMFVKGSSIGVAGFVGTNISQEDFDYLEKKRIGIPVVEVDEDSLKQLVAWDGKMVMVEGEEKKISLV